MSNDDVMDRLMESSMVELLEPVQTSTGPAYRYLDVLSAAIHEPRFFQQWYRERVDPYVPVGIGRSGALLLGLLAPVLHYRAYNRQGGLACPDKDHGLRWHNKPREGSQVCLIDDCMFTGGTMIWLARYCMASGLRPVRIVVAHNAFGPRVMEGELLEKFLAPHVDLSWAPGV
jgi:hypothetical protein